MPLPCFVSPVYFLSVEKGVVCMLGGRVVRERSGNVDWKCLLKLSPNLGAVSIRPCAQASASAQTSHGGHVASSAILSPL